MDDAEKIRAFRIEQITELADMLDGITELGVGLLGTEELIEVIVTEIVGPTLFDEGRFGLLA